MKTLLSNSEEKREYRDLRSSVLLSEGLEEPGAGEDCPNAVLCEVILSQHSLPAAAAAPLNS